MSKMKGKHTTSAQAPSQKTSRAWDALAPELSEWIIDAVDSMGFERMTPVQATTIPLFLGNKDPVVEAVTGSGKTLAFLIPVVQRLLRLEDPLARHHVGAIIISPTRELATQIHEVLVRLLGFHGPSAARLAETRGDDDHTTIAPSANHSSSSGLTVVPQLLLGGGVTVQQDLSYFLTRSPNLIIATPGRLDELLSSPHVHTPQSSFQVLIMDEADRLLDMGFKEKLTSILNRLPKQRRTGLFSASVSDAVEQLVRIGIQNPYRINVKVQSASGKEGQRTPAALEMKYITTTPTQKLPALLRLVHSLDPPPFRTIAYLPTCISVDYFQHLIPALLSLLYPDSALQVVPLHGKHKQNIRDKNMKRFISSSSPSLLLTTDLAARGLDIAAVDLTVQLDPPTDEKSFLHRAGRAGRAGRKGLAVVFLLPGRETEDYPPFLAVRKTPVTELTGLDLTLADIQIDESVRALRKVVREDRALHEKAQQAFPSYVQAYRKHSASSIFRVTELPWTELADAWGLLKMPRMPELTKSNWEGDKSLGLDVNWEKYKYADKVRERERKARLPAIAAPETNEPVEAQRLPAAKRKADSWSSKHEAQETKEARREKRAKRRENEKRSLMDDDDKARDAGLQRLIVQVRGEKVIRETEDREKETG